MENSFAQIKDFFKDLNFNEEKHLYDVNGKHLPSVSGLIKTFTPYFDAEAKAKSKAERYGVSHLEILQEWEDTKNEACDRGHRVHLFGEKYPFDRTLKPSCGQEKAVVKFWNDLPAHILPAFMELRMYHKHFNFAGTADILLFDTINKCFIIGDYKTNKDLFKNFKQESLLYPFTNLLNSPFNKYQTQLSFYQLLFEQTGFKVSGRKLIWLLKTGDYIMYDTDNLTGVLNKYVAELN